ncbi:MAG: ABC transporter permease [Myxococcaceae bacterium]
MSDLKLALRALSRAPGFTLTALLALALGIGANTAIFSVVSPVLFRPLPFPEPERLVAVVPHHLLQGSEGNFSLPTFRDVRAQQSSFEALAAFTQGSAAVGAPGEPVRLKVLYAEDAFATLKLPALYGRMLNAADHEASAPPVAVLSHWAFVKHFGGDPQVVGRPLQVDGKAFTLVGVAPDSFKLPLGGKGPGLYAPLMTHSDTQRFGTRRGHHHLSVIGRLKPGVTLEAARLELDGIFTRLEQEHDEEKNLRAKVVDLQERSTGDTRPAALVLALAVALVLLIACANVAGLMVVRSGARQRELAIRLALGAGRWRVVRQVLTEAVLLSIAGAGLGLLVALWTLDGLKALVGSRLPDVGLDGPVLAFTALVAVLTGLAFGAVPALHASRVGLHEALKDGGNRASLSKGRRRAQGALISVQVALAFALLAGAGLMFQSLYALTRLDPGFDPGHLVSVKLPLPDWSFSLDQKRVFYRQALERAAALPGVVAVGSGDPFPFSDGNSRNTVYPDGQRPARGEEQAANMYEVSQGYFEAMRIPLREGRTFAPGEGQRPVVIVSQKLAARFWPNESALGKRLHTGGEPREVIGVVGDVRHGALDAEVKLAHYLPFEQSDWMEQRLLLRTAGPPEALTATLRKLVRELDPSLPVPEPELVSALIEQSNASRRLTLAMLAAFSGVALLLAALGLWGLIAYAVGQRRQELAIRKALGASNAHLVGLVLRQGLVLTGAGLAAGAALALFGSRLLKALLYGVEAADPLTYLVIGLVLGGVALLACYLPARAAVRVDPNVALRA